MLKLFFKCPECNQIYEVKGYMKWIFKYPFHIFGKRKTKCPYCEKYSYVRWQKIER